MDHAIAALRPYFEVEMEELQKEWATGNYDRISACPSYKPTKALIDAMHSLERYYHGKPVTRSIEDRLRGDE